MVTLNKASDISDFGTVEGDHRVPLGQIGSPYIEASQVGLAIKRTLRAFFCADSEVRLLQYALMPDHLHLLMLVKQPTTENLGQLVARFKVAVNLSMGNRNVFERGFNDQILKNTRRLDTLYTYLRENPRRLAIRHACPEYFRRVLSLNIGGKFYRAYGNFQLLKNPFKEQVVVHRADSRETLEHKRELWHYTAANGGVLVSPFISKTEKEVRAEAEALGGRFILIQHKQIAERWKPAAHDFDLCTQGRLLILHRTDSPVMLSREACLMMNEAAYEMKLFKLISRY